MFFKYKKNIDSFTKKLNERLMLEKINSILVFTLQGQNVQFNGTPFLLPSWLHWEAMFDLVEPL